ncbi:MAG: hypothetical protein ACR2IK_16335 [Chloroflexota bacterium]
MAPRQGAESVPEAPPRPEIDNTSDGPAPASEIDTVSDAPGPASEIDTVSYAADTAEVEGAAEPMPDAEDAGVPEVAMVEAGVEGRVGGPQSGAPDAAEMAVGAEKGVAQAGPKQPSTPADLRFRFQAPQDPPVEPVLSSGTPFRAGPRAASSEPVYATAFLPASLPRSAELSLPSTTNEVREFIRHAALDRGIDPDVAVRVALSEGGLTPVTWAGDHASSFGPYQLHYGGIAPGANAVPGLGDAFTAETGLRANETRTWRQQVEWTLDHAVRSGWTPWHGAAAAGINAFDGLSGTRNLAVQPAGVRRHVDVPDQFAAQLSAPEAYAACGPVAAVAVARWLGRNPTVVEALETAKRTGWTVKGGMNGISNEKRLLDAMRISAHLDTTVDWRHVQQDASSGNPVIVSTPQHYWVIDDFDPNSGKYHVGQSGLVYRGGGDWMSAAQIQQLGGAPNGALFVDNPLVARPSVAATPPVADVTLDRWWEAEHA